MTTRRNPNRRCKQAAILGARPPSPRLSSCSSNDEYFTPTSGPSSDESEVPTTSAPRRPVRRGRPPLPARLGPSDQAGPSTAPATGSAVRTRMRWTHQLNQDVMRAYYGATKGGTALTSYRSKMLSLFQALQPTVTVTAQRLSDQVRVIQRLGLLEAPVLEQLRGQSQPAPSEPALENVNMAPRDPFPESDANVHEQVSISHQDIERLRSTLENVMKEYRSMPIFDRPQLPRLPLNPYNISLVNAYDQILKTYIDSSSDLTDTHSILYCGAVAACYEAGVRLPASYHNSRPVGTPPLWKQRIERRITVARTIIAKLYCFQAGNTRPKIMRFVKQAFAGTGINSNNYFSQIVERIDFWKQKVYAWAKRIKRYSIRTERYSINKIFQRDQRSVYRNWHLKDQTLDKELPNIDEMSTFWRNIWSIPINHSENECFEVVRRACESISEMSPVAITASDVKSAVGWAPNWKSPGPDRLHAYWIKSYRSSHERLATQFQQALESGNLPNFMTTGLTHLIHKSGSTSDPKNFRPITCLPIIYKTLTSILRTKINAHVMDNNILSPTQNGCKAKSRGTKDLLLIDMAISQQVRRSKRNVYMAWIDYKKAYDSVPHSWLKKILKLYRIHPTLCNFLSTCMEQWSTILLHPGHVNSFDSSNLVKIKRGIFQGDSLSPLWFCLALNPLSTLLKCSGIGYRLRRENEAISHLLYMDDLKLYASKKPDLMKLLKITDNFSKAIGMEFGVDKCAVLNIQKGRIVNSECLQVSEDVSLKCLSENETYKYLGMSEALGITDADMKQLLRERFYSRLTKVLKSLLSGGNKVRAFNSWVMPVLAYSFGILRWTQTELDAVDRKVRRLLTTYRMHHPRSSVMRMYISRKCGGRGFLNAKDLHNREVYNLREYFLKVNVDMYRNVVSIDKGLTPLSLATENWRKPKVMSISDRTAIWKDKELHGRFHRALTGSDVDQLASVTWLRFGNLFGETEGFIFAIMDEVIMTNNYRRHILKDGTVDICRACHRPGESIRHIVSGCSRLANGEYLHRHNQVARIIHQQLAFKYGLVNAEVPYYQYQPQPVLENDHVTLYWDRSIITDRYIAANKPDIVIIDRSTRRVKLIDITIPHDENLVKAEKEKMIKYLDLAHEVTAMWSVESTSIIPIVVSVHGLISKSFDEHLNQLSISGWVKPLIQKAVLLETARIVRRFLSLQH